MSIYIYIYAYYRTIYIIYTLYYTDMFIEYPEYLFNFMSQAHSKLTFVKLGLPDDANHSVLSSYLWQSVLRDFVVEDYHLPLFHINTVN